MNRAHTALKTLIFGVISVYLMSQSLSFAKETPIFAVALQGYDVVAYFTENKPVKGNGDHVVIKDGVYYLFSTDDNKTLFQKNPDNYLPQYGGWCAFGASVGKKISSDPLAWKIIDGKLYLNLNSRVQKLWEKDTAGYIKKADSNWVIIKDKDATNL